MLTLELVGEDLIEEYRSRLVGNQRFSVDARRFCLELDRRIENCLKSKKR